MCSENIILKLVLGTSWSKQECSGYVKLQNNVRPEQKSAPGNLVFFFFCFFFCGWVLRHAVSSFQHFNLLFCITLIRIIGLSETLVKRNCFKISSMNIINPLLNGTNNKS